MEFVLQLQHLETDIAAATGAILGVLVILKLDESMRTNTYASQKK